tara:strand:+ start:35 stop:1189 length:1155 start_codon:yes stop_codon:yes gene_type:complete
MAEEPKQLNDNEALSYLQNPNNSDLITHFEGLSPEQKASSGGNLIDFAKIHYDLAGRAENRQIEAPVETQTFSLSAEDRSSLIDDIKSNIPASSVDRSVSISQTGPEIDYGRIQGFVGVPEIRDEEGNITQQATGIYAQQPQLPPGLMASQEATQQAIGQAAVDPDTGEVIQPATLFEGQSALGAGQAQLETQLGAGQAGLMAGQQVLGAGQETMGQAIGVPDEQQPQTLFGGQRTLGQGQAGIQTGVTGLGKDLSSLTGNISDFEKMQRAYQTRAEGQRAQGREIGMTTRDQLEDQLRTVGSQTNRIAEQQAQQRRLGMMGPPPQAQQPPVMPQAQQATQAAQIAGQNLRSFAPQGGGMMGPTGPVAVDPRDQVGFGPTRSPV